ncbi:hypothetical protein ACJ41O_010532 [Fusarium nematophilum]
MDTQTWRATMVDHWTYSPVVTAFVVPYPHFYLFPTRTVARYSRSLGPLASEKESSDITSKPFSTVPSPFGGFCIWIISELFRTLLRAFLEPRVPSYLLKVIPATLSAPFTLMWTRAILSENPSSLKHLVKSICSVKATSWLQYISVLVACESVEALSNLLMTLIFGDMTLEPVGGLMPTLALVGRVHIPHLMAVLQEAGPITVASVQAALSIPYSGFGDTYGGGRGFWDDIYRSLKGMTFSLWRDLFLNFCVGFVVVMGVVLVETFVGIRW